MTWAVEMSNYWAIAIGINQYQQFQPLLYAQWDAQALWNYWVKEGGIPQTQCMLLTDGMVADSSPPPIPTKQGIEQNLNQLGHHRIGTDDVVWCFFSGYGLHIQGSDYLIPLDGDPQQVPQTGIAAESFFALLNAFPTRRVVVLLDLKRPPNTDPEMRLGDDILRHAQTFNIATLLASQPDQVSNETLTLRQGLFTFAVIEGLRTQGCFQLEQLTQYVQTRLPKLSEDHWRGRQDVALAIPQEQAQQQLLPAVMVGATSGVRSPQTPLGQTVPNASTQFPFQPAPSSQTPFQAHGESVQLPPLDKSRPDAAPTPSSATVSNANRTVPPGTPPAKTIKDETPESRSSQPSSFWSGLVLLMLGILAVVVFRNLPALQGTTTATPPGVEGDGQPSLPNDSDAVDPQVPIDMTPVGDAVSALERAKAAQAVGMYDEALRWLDQVPASAQTTEYATLRAELEQFRNQTGQRNQAILNEAIASLNQERTPAPVIQASDFGRAMALANRIQPGQPLYDEAQGYVQRWGQVILDLAKARAQSGAYGEAIAAASMIEPSLPLLYQQAQTLIKEWQQYLDTDISNQDIIDGAEARIQYGNTLSYSRAIREVMTISPGQPQYEQARQLLDTWSREIFAMANTKASQDNLLAAIETAEMIPPEAPVSLEARQAIGEWGEQLANR
ncbi:MAG: caspase family protein [Leptolyngbyaceae cyanobacterium]